MKLNDKLIFQFIPEQKKIVPEYLTYNLKLYPKFIRNDFMSCEPDNEKEKIIFSHMKFLLFKNLL
jgi:hypothetical protein